jgi:acyl-CoA synthetase (AMP-forming)/AMP-acid ligase II
MATQDNTLIGLIDAACTDNHDRDCLIFGEQRLNYQTVREASCRVANGLLAAGVGKGAICAIFSPNDPWAFAAMLGVVRSGAIWAPINPRNSADDNLALLQAFGCEALFFHSAFESVASRIRAQHPELRLAICIDQGNEGAPSLQGWMQEQSAAAPPNDASPQDIVMIPMTGGTTGLPKAVALSNRNLAAMLRGVAAIEPGHRPLNLLAAPMTHVGGRLALTVMYRGGVSVILTSAEPGEVLRAVERHRVTDLFLPPTAIYALIDHPETRRTDLSSLRSIFYGSAPMSVDKLKQALALFGPVMVGGLGQTEAPMLITRLPPEDHFVEGRVAPDSRLRSVGRATASSRVAIMSESGALLPPGEPGEIVVQGAFVSEGYFRNPEATAAARRNGWHLTGDIGVLDEHGYLTIVDRKKDMIITGGFNVYSAEVEGVISAMPGVRECIVIGAPDEKWGEAVTAIVVADAAPPSADEIVAAARAALGPVKAPKAVHFVDALPRNANGKVDKKAVRERYWVGKDRRI